jgi:hypothetical protein
MPARRQQAGQASEQCACCKPNTSTILLGNNRAVQIADTTAQPTICNTHLINTSTLHRLSERFTARPNSGYTLYCKASYFALPAPAALRHVTSVMQTRLPIVADDQTHQVIQTGWMRSSAHLGRVARRISGRHPSKSNQTYSDVMALIVLGGQRTSNSLHSW